MYSRVLIVIVVIYGVLGVNGEDETKGSKTEDGQKVKVDDQYDLPGHGGVHQSAENDEMIYMPCGLLAVPFGWSSTPEDPSKGYPDCCAQPLAPLDLVPDVLDSNPGYNGLEIIYGDVMAELGNELTPTQVKAEPVVNYTYWADPESYYLLIMTDPDTSSSQDPESREFLHWMVGNIPGDDVKSGEVIAEYVGSGPTQGTGLHRYFFLLFKQPGKLTFDEEKITKTSVGWRNKFSTRKFAQKYGLKIPMAMNVFRAQYDDYVPEIHKQLGFTAPQKTNDKTVTILSE